jgi:signal peptidase
MQHRLGTRVATSAGSLLLTLAAIGGVICILAVVAATFFQISLILFKTGSMSPTIPAGSVALVRQVPADEVRVGDVVTVDRTGQLPITHRIVAVAAAANGEVSLTLRGDANRQDDPAPYLVTHVRLVLLSVPQAAPLIVFISNPLVLGGVAVGASILVGWAFWPRQRARPSASGRRGRRSVASGGAGVSLAILVALASVLAPAPSAHAETAETVISGKYLTLTSVADPIAFASLRPANPVRWTVGVSAHPPDPAAIHLGLSAAGRLAHTDGLHVAIITCTKRWSGSTCPGRTTKMLADQAVSTALAGLPPGGVREVGEMPSSGQRWLAIDVTLPAGRNAGGSADLQVHAWGAGDQVQTTGPPASLADTGTDLPGLALLLAAGAVIAGTGAAAIESRRRVRVTRGGR